MCFGSDLDIRVLKGSGVARVAGAAYEGMETANVFTNYDLHGLPCPDIFRMDFTQPSLRRVEIFDAIICDPPYGIRAAAKKFGKHSKKEGKTMLTEKEYADKFKRIGKNLQYPPRSSIRACTRTFWRVQPDL